MNRRYSAASDFLTAMCMWKAANRVFLVRSGFTIREAPSISGDIRRYVSGRLSA